MIYLLVVLGCIGFAALVYAVVNRWASRPRVSEREKELEDVVANIFDLANRSRDTDPDLSVIITDEITRFYRGQRKEVR